MPVFESVQTALETHIEAQLAAIAKKVYENAETPSPDLFDEWVRFSVSFGESKRLHLGTGAYRHPGILFAQIFTKQGSGINRGVEIADLITAALRDQVVSNINLLVSSVIKVPFADGGWSQVQVSTPFYIDEVT